MEIFLLLLDDLDDMAGSMRMLWRPIASFLTALVLFAATGYWVIHMPLLAILLLGASLLLLFAVQTRRRVLQPSVNPE